jgi:chemosensory pili system protein ChpA (sensor histidine kinase/response regulator)
MTEIYDPNQLVGASQDVAPLAWVIDEIRTAFGQALAGVRNFLGNKQDLDGLRDARNQIHQSNGALQLLDLRGVALVAEAVEQLLQRWESRTSVCLRPFAASSRRCRRFARIWSRCCLAVQTSRSAFTRTTAKSCC